MVDHEVCGRCQDALRQRLGLREQRPRPEGQRESGIGSLPCGLDRNNIEHPETLDTIRQYPKTDTVSG